MKALQSIEAEYENGRITAHEAAVGILCNLTGDNEHELDRLCLQLRQEVKETLRACICGCRTTGSTYPDTLQIEIGKIWLQSQNGDF